MKSLYITGYKSYELNIFNDTVPEVSYLKAFIKQKLLGYIDQGLSWVIIQGQLGIELWAAEVVMDLQEAEYDIQFAVITPFLDHTQKWNEANMQKYQNIIAHAAYVNSVHQTPYQSPQQFKQADQFILDNTDATMLIYDEEQEASPKFFKRMLVDFAHKTNYTYDIVTFDEIMFFINDLQWSQD